MRRSVGLCLFLCLAVNGIYAQYRFRPWVDAGTGFVSLSGLGVSLYLQYKTPPLSQARINLLDRQDINRFDRPATYQWSPGTAKLSDGLALVSGLLPLIYAVDQRSRSEALPVIHVAAQSTLLSLSLANAFKLTKRERPFMYNENTPIEKKLKSDARMSFFSAHTATVSSLCFSFAFAWKEYHPDSKAMPYIYSGAVLVPAIEAYLRVKAGKHYPTDVIAGYLCGLGASYLMHRLHQK